MIQSVKTTYIKKMQIKENDTTLIAYIWETTNTNRQRFLIGMGHDEGSENKLSLWTESFIPTVTLVASLYGVLCTMYHRMQKLQSAAEERNLVQELLLRAESHWNHLHNQQNWGNETIEECWQTTQRSRTHAQFKHWVTFNHLPSIYSRTGYKRQTWSLAHQHCESEPGIHTT